MSEWKEVRLGDVSTINAGGDAPRGNMSKVKNEKFFIPIYSNGIDNQGLYGFTNKAIIDRPACTITARGTIGVVFNRKEPFYPIVRLISVIADESIIKNDFLYYLLRNTRIKGDGSVQEQFTVPMAKDIHLKIPTSIENQDQITGILSSLDAKIETNNKLNEKLEEMAQAIFKSWFVDFEPFKDKPFHETELGMIPEGWNVCCLGDITKQTKEKVGSNRFLKVLSPINTGELTLSEDYFTKQVYSKDISKYILVRKNNFAYNPARVNIGSLGRNEYDFDGCVSPVYVVFEVIEEYENFFDLFRRQKTFINSVISLAIGGVRQSLSYNDFSYIKLVVPPKNVIEKFNDIYAELDKLKKTKKIENDRLASLRDTLLPRLMSGELIV